MWTKCQCWTKKCFMSTKKVGVAQKSISCRQKQDDSAPKKTKICSKKLLIFSGCYTILFQLILYSLNLRLYLLANLYRCLLISMIILIKKTCQGLYLLFQLLWIYDELLVLFWTDYISAPDCASPTGRRFGRRHLTISIYFIFKDAGWHYPISSNIGGIQV